MSYKQNIDGCFSEITGASGIDDNLLESCVKRIDAAAKKLENPPPLFTLPLKNDYLKEIRDTAKKIRSKFKNLVILGTGGSTLSGQALFGMVKAENSFSSKGVKLYFAPNVDPYGFSAMLKGLKLKETCFLVISKSGNTIETLAQFSICIKEIKKKLGKAAIKKHFIIITDNADNPLRLMGKKLGIKIINHEKIGGRFSVFSNVGLLPAAIAGLDIEKIRKGAAKIINNFIKGDKEIIRSAALNLAFMEKKISINVMMPYTDRLCGFASWQRQIWAESLGKNGKGSTPIKAMGTLDQHSQLQLYLDGPADKLFTIMLVEKHDGDISIPDTNDKTLSYLKNRKMGDVMNACAKATIETLIKNKRPVRSFVIKKLDEETLGSLIMHFVFETVLVAYALNLNPFDQPAVEDGKILARKMLGK